MNKYNGISQVGKQVGGYVRVSTFEQAEKGTSIDEQKKVIRQECKRRGWQLIEIYCDEGVSGKISDRQGLHRLQCDALVGKFQVVMFTKSDRLTRSIRDLNNLWHDWTEAGLDIICVQQPEINSEGLCGKLIRNLLGIFAEWERDAIIERTTSGRMARWQNYEAIIGRLPFGYDLDRENRKIVIVPEKKAICKRIFNMYLDRSMNIRDIAIQFTKESVPTPSGKNAKWNHTTINNILKNCAYAGRADLNRFKYKMHIGCNGQQHTKRTKDKKDRSKWITLCFPPIISKDRYKMVQDRMKSNKWILKHSCYENKFLLKNILVCGECGGKMKILSAPSKCRPGERYTYYRCYWNKMSQKELLSLQRTGCDMVVKSEALDNFVLSQVMGFLDSVLTFTRERMSELNLKKIMEGIQQWKDDVSAVQQIHRIKYDKYRTAEIQLSVRRNDTNMLNMNSSHAYEKDILRATRQLRLPDSLNSTKEMSSCIEEIPFEEKRRVVESVINPENGGRCVVRWATQLDVCDCGEELTEQEAKRLSQIKFVKAPPIIEVTFCTDLKKIQTLIWNPKQDKQIDP